MVIGLCLMDFGLDWVEFDKNFADSNWITTRKPEMPFQLALVPILEKGHWVILDGFRVGLG